jgi:hypothetical protein
MQLSPLVKVLIILNNYFHDVATAMLFSSALIIWLLARSARHEGADALRRLESAYPLLTLVAWFSLAWIVIGGIPRALFFQQVEWNLADTSNKYLFAALMVKHAFMWSAVAAGAVMWVRTRKLLRAGEDSAHAAGHEDSDR